MIILFLYCIMFFVTASLFLLNAFAENSHFDGEDICVYSALGVLFGLVWPIAIWISLLKWWASDDTPKWVEKIQDIRDLLKKSE